MKKKKIMVVDDEEDFLKIIKINLEQGAKYEVLTLSNAKNIIANAHDYRPDIILLDILMPGIYGIDACEMLNKDPIGKDIPIIIISALDKNIDKLKAYKAGVVDYLVKPVAVEDIIAKVEKNLRSK